MEGDLYYDDRKLTQMIEGLSVKQRMKVARSAFGMAARKLRKKAIGYARASGLRTNKYVERGIRAVVYRRKAAGFRITVGTKKRKVNYNGLSGAALTVARKHNREAAIVALWAEGGTVERGTRRHYGRQGHGTGSMPAFGFMEQTRQEAEAEGVRVEKELIMAVEREVRKNGGTMR